jgi:uncharacterized protein YjbI with pentapeptide repeats
MPRVNFSTAKLQGADLSSATIIGSIMNGTKLRTAILPEKMEFSAIIGEPNWDEFELLLSMLNAPWAKGISSVRLENLKTRLTKAENSTKIFTKPDLPPKNNQAFVQAWLEVVCIDAATAKAMLRDNIFGRKLPTEITDTALRNWLKTNAECKSYQAMGEEAIKSRARRKSVEP